MRNIYIVGRPLDLYRTQAFVSTLMEYRYDLNISISYFTVTSKSSMLSNYIKKIIVWFLNYVHAMFEVIRADYVYFPAMSLHQSSFSRTVFSFSNLLHKKCICDFYISCFDTEVLDRGLISENSHEAKKLLRLDKKQQESYKCIYLTSTEVIRYSRLCGLKPSINSLVIPLTVRYREVASLPFFNKKTPFFTIMWWGTYIPLHGLDRIIEAVRIVLQKDKKVMFYILGNSDEKSEEFKSIIQQYNLDNNIIVNNNYTFSNGKLEPFIINNCDLAMGAFGESEKAKSVVLNKCIEAVSMKIPVLTQESPAFAEFFENDDSSIFYSDNHIQNIANKILEIKEMNSSQVFERVNTCYDIYKCEFSEEATQKHYRKLFESLK